MRAIALSLLVLVLAVCLAAEQKAVKPELADRIGDLAGALADGNASSFMHQFDRRMAGYEDLRQKVERPGGGGSGDFLREAAGAGGAGLAGDD